MKYKYLREKTDDSTSTSLKTYLDHLYPVDIFIYDERIPPDVFDRRNKLGIKQHAYKPDARCEELNLVIEVDGLPHYQSSATVFADISKDMYYKQLGYSVIRIPYWLQITPEFCKHVLHKDVQEACNLYFSFFDVKDANQYIHCYAGAASCIGSMCEIGRYRFIEQFNKLDQSLQNIVMTDILTCRIFSVFPDITAPDYVLNRLVMKDKRYEFNRYAIRGAKLLNKGDPYET